MTTLVFSPKAPKAIGPYSQALLTNGMLYTSGQIALDPDTGELKNETFEQEVQRVLDNLQAIVQEAGGTMRDVVRLTIYVTDMGLFGKVNEAMSRCFSEPYPVRSTVGVAQLPRGARVEIDVTARID